ncbi:MAG: FHA domain-containing protein [Myxococcota bacterium]
MFAVVITEKGGAQRRMEFDKSEVTIGRVQGNDIILPKGNVSKRHSRIVLKDSRFIVVDLKSTNGTYVNGRKITSPLVVKPGDKVYIGDFILTVEDLGGYPAEADAAPARRGPPPLRSSPPPAPAPQPAMPAQPVGGQPPALGQPAMGQPAMGQPAAPSMPMGPPVSQSAPIAPQAPSAPAPAPAPSQPVQAQPPAPQPAPVHPTAPTPAPQQPAPQPAPQAPPPAQPQQQRSQPPAAEPSFGLEREPEPPTRAPERPVAPPVVAPAPTGLPAVMAALRTAFPTVEDTSGVASGDPARWNDARAKIADVMAELAGQGSVDANDSALAGAALREAVGLGAFEALLADAEIAEIVVEGPSKVLVDRGQGLVPSEAGFSSAAMLGVIAKRLVSRSAKSLEGPVLTAVLPEGGHATVILPPVAIGGPIVEIRKGGGASIEAFVARGVVSNEAVGALRNAVMEGKTIAVVGPADADVSGLVAALAGMVDPSDRVVAVSRGASPNIDLPHVVHLAGDVGGPDLGEVALQAARMRADHLLVDGVANGSAFDVFAALASHGGGGFLGANGMPSQDPGYPLVFLASLSGRSAETAAQLVARAVQVIVHVAKEAEGSRVVGVSEVTGVTGAQLTTNALA